MTIDETELIASFYEAAFDATLWPQALRQLGSIHQSVGACLLVWDGHADRTAHVAIGGDAEWQTAADAYARYYADIDPYRPLITAAPVGAWIPCAAFFDQQFVTRSEFYNDFLLPRGVRYNLAARLLEAEDFTAYLGIQRGPGHEPFSKPEIERIERLGSNLARAIKLYLNLARTRLENAASSLVLERLAAPAVLVDETGRVLFSNVAAEAVLRRDEGIGVQHGRLRATRTAEDERLQNLISHTARGFVPAQIGGEMLLERPAGQPPIVLVVAPVGPMTALHSLPAISAGVLVLFNDPTRHAGQSTERLQMLFGLTKAEATLARALLDGRRLTEIASSRSVSIETVRTQLQSLLRKTGASRQADLMRILLTVPDGPQAS